MKKLFLISLITLSSMILFSCSSAEIPEKTSLASENNTDINENNLKNNKNDKKNIDKDKKIILADNYISSSPFIFDDATLFFPNWDDNEKISLIQSPDKAIKITKDAISEFFDYSTNSMTLFQNNIFFANGNDNYNLYKLNLTTKEANLISNFPIDNICNNGVNVYFTNSKTKELFSYDAIDNITTKLTKDKISKFIINGKNIFYQNASDGHALYSLNLDSNEKTKLTNFSVDSFVPDDKTIYCINSDDHNSLYALDITNLSTRRLSTLNATDLNKVNDTFLFIDRNDANKLKSLKIDLKENTFKTDLLVDEGINNYFLSSKGIFYRKSIDVNSTYYFLPIKEPK